MYSVSVAMAAYNGENYIKPQLESILSQLKADDEVIVSLDPSTDSTKEIIQSLNDRRIKVIEGPGQGVKKNFENAIVNCKNDIIFLADQDDIWLDGKVERVLSEFKEGVCVVMHDCSIVDNDMNVIASSFFEMRQVKTGLVHNWIRNSYIGCCMAFKRDIVKYIVPIPEKIYMHDQWIGMVGEKVGKNILIHESYLLYRRHGENVTGIHHGSLNTMMKKRMGAFMAYFDLRKRLR